MRIHEKLWRSACRGPRGRPRCDSRGAGERSEEIRCRCERYRDQDRHHHALYRAGCCLCDHRAHDRGVFKKINAEGGLNGRKLNLIASDDSYNPATTLQQARRLVEDEQVLLIFAGLGTQTNAAIRDYMNARKVPQLFVVG